MDPSTFYTMSYCINYDLVGDLKAIPLLGASGVSLASCSSKCISP